MRSGAGSSAVPLLPIQLRRTQDIRCRPSGLFLPNVACDSSMRPHQLSVGAEVCRWSDSSRSKPVDRPMLAVFRSGNHRRACFGWFQRNCADLQCRRAKWGGPRPDLHRTRLCVQARKAFQSGLDGSPIPLREGALQDGAWVNGCPSTGAPGQQASAAVRFPHRRPARQTDFHSPSLRAWLPFTQCPECRGQF